MHARSRRRLQDTLTAVRLGTPVSGAGPALFPHAERHLPRRVRRAQAHPQGTPAAARAIAAANDPKDIYRRVREAGPEPALLHALHRTLRRPAD